MKNVQPISRFFEVLRTCLKQIHGYNSLFVEVESLRTNKYDCENKEHEKQLMKVTQNNK